MNCSNRSVLVIIRPLWDVHDPSQAHAAPCGRGASCPDVSSAASLPHGARMATCPECDFDEIETEDFEEGDTLSCPECGKNLVVTGADEVEFADEDDDDLDDDDLEEEDEDEDDDEEEDADEDDLDDEDEDLDE